MNLVWVGPRQVRLWFIFRQTGWVELLKPSVAGLTRQAQFSWHRSFGCWIFQVKNQFIWGYWLWSPTMMIFCPRFSSSFILLCLTLSSSSSSSSSSCASTTLEVLCSSSSKDSSGFIRPYRKVKNPFNQSELPSSTSNQSKTSDSPWPSPSLVKPT